MLVMLPAGSGVSPGMLEPDPVAADDGVVLVEAGCSRFSLPSPSSPQAAVVPATVAPRAIIAARPRRPTGGFGKRARIALVTAAPQNGQHASVFKT
jgi:hypothetical protein